MARDGDTPNHITRNIPDYEILSDRDLTLIESQAERILSQIGVDFVGNPDALDRWRQAGARVEGERVRLPEGLARDLCATAPASFVQHARNPARNVTIGGRNLVCAPVYGPLFVRDQQHGRRYAGFADFCDFLRLGQVLPQMHHSGGTVCEPTDLPIATRHLDMLLAHMTLTDKPLMGSVTLPERASDSLAMARILFGADAVDRHCVLSALINVNSPLTFDPVMSHAIDIYSGAGQAVILGSYVVTGTTAPATVAGALAQTLAEMMAGIAYTQLVRPGAPVVFGPFVAGMGLVTGAATFATPEVAQLTQALGQLARRLGVPYRGGGALTGSKLPDAQAGYEAAQGLSIALQSGVNLMTHAAGWLENGLVACFEKYVMDADQLTALAHMAQGVDLSDAALGLKAIRQAGPGGHYLGSAHLADHGDGMWQSTLMDCRPFDQWQDAGSPDAAMLAADRVRHYLDIYRQPDLDPATASALASFVTRRKADIAACDS